jgi:tripartite ATP-independent transporter DctM subunit
VIPIEWMPPLMFTALIVVMLLGFPVAFSLSALGLGFFFYGVHAGFFNDAFMGNVWLRMFGTLSNELLLAIPFFTLMGAILERCGLAEDLLEGTGQLFGKVPGGLGFAVIVVGAILGAITGTVAASVIAMGLISLPVMMRYGYNMRYATGVIAASGTITQLIPPSLVLIVLADALSTATKVTVGDMYRGAIGPSILQTGIFLAYTAAIALFRPQWVPPLPPEARITEPGQLWRKVLWGMVPSIVLIFLVLGTIFLGIATPTEAGALGAVGALVLAALHKRLTWKLIVEGVDSTMRVSVMVMFILIGSTIFSTVFQGVDGNQWVEHHLSSLPGGQIGFLIAVNLVIFVLAFFLDFFEIAFIVLPMVAPVAHKLGIDMVWFGVMLCVNMQTSFMHPPFGFALFYLRGIADQAQRTGAILKPVLSRDIYLGAIPWVVMQLVLVVVVIAWPQSVTYWLEKEVAVDLDKVKLEAPAIEEEPEPQMPVPEPEVPASQ